MKTFNMTIHFKPVAEGRSRTSLTSRQGKVRVHHYTPKSTRDYRTRVRLIMDREFGGDIFKKPISVAMTFMFGTDDLTLYGMPHKIKPDLSNLIKSIEDAGNGIIWHDDCLISALRCHKIWDKRSGVILQVSEV